MVPAAFQLVFAMETPSSVQTCKSEARASKEWALEHIFSWSTWILFIFNFPLLGLILVALSFSKKYTFQHNYQIYYGTQCIIFFSFSNAFYNHYFSSQCPILFSFLWCIRHWFIMKIFVKRCPIHFCNMKIFSLIPFSLLILACFLPSLKCFLCKLVLFFSKSLVDLWLSSRWV